MQACRRRQHFESALDQNIFKLLSLGQAHGCWQVESPSQAAECVCLQNSIARLLLVEVVSAEGCSTSGMTCHAGLPPG